MADAAKNEVGIQITLKGADRAARELDAIIAKGRQSGAVEAGAGAGGQGGSTSGATTSGGGGKGGEQGSGQGGPGAVAMAGAVAIGSVVGAAVQRSLGAVQRAVSVGFDPNLTRLERDANQQRAMLEAVPVVGGIGAARFQAQNQVPVGAAQSLNAQINGSFAGAARAIGLQNPGASPEQLATLIKEQLGEPMRQLADALASGELAREIGSQAAARVTDAALEGKGVRLQESAGESLARGTGDAAGFIASNIAPFIADLAKAVGVEIYNAMAPEFAKLTESAKGIERSLNGIGKR